MAGNFRLGTESRLVVRPRGQTEPGPPPRFHSFSLESRSGALSRGLALPASNAGSVTWVDKTKRKTGRGNPRLPAHLAISPAESGGIHMGVNPQGANPDGQIQGATACWGHDLHDPNSEPSFEPESPGESPKVVTSDGRCDPGVSCNAGSQPTYGSNRKVDRTASPKSWSYSHSPPYRRHRIRRSGDQRYWPRSPPPCAKRAQRGREVGAFAH